MDHSDTARRALLSSAHLDQFERPLAVTLTMKLRASGRACDPVTASRNFRHFMNRLNRTVFGQAAKRYGKSLRVLPVLEQNQEGRLHYHAIIDRPERMEIAEFGALVRDTWLRTDFGYRHIDVQPVTGDGWVAYLCKKRQKPEGLLDSIDWNNCTSTLG